MHILMVSQCSWSAIFLWVYTSQIAFAAIDSQGVCFSELREAQDGHSPDEKASQQDSEGSRPPPLAVVAESCSPKSVYHLANKVRPTHSLGNAVTNTAFA